MELKERERKVDVSKLTPEQLSALEAQIGGKMREICDKACEEANRILAVYGMKAKMQFLVHDQELTKEDVQKQLKPTAQGEPKKRRGRSKKLSQSLS